MNNPVRILLLTFVVNIALGVQAPAAVALNETFSYPDGIPPAEPVVLPYERVQRKAGPGRPAFPLRRHGFDYKPGSPKSRQECGKEPAS